MINSIEQTLRHATRTLLSKTETPQLDAEVLLAHVLHVSRSYLMAFSERVLTPEEQACFAELLSARVNGMPIAYLIQHKEFWSLDFFVTPDTLIPRPDTELLVELVLKTLSDEKKMIADLGTGSGAIALSLAHERALWEVHATDKSHAALAVAKINAEKFHLAHVVFHQGEWCDALPEHILFDAIISNPPYIAKNDVHLQQGDLRFEPQSALVADENGLKEIRDIILSAKKCLKSGGFLFLEHGFQQAKAVKQILMEQGYQSISLHQDLAGLDRVTAARSPLIHQVRE